MGAGTILVVEDDPDINALLAKIVAREGFQAVPAFSGTEALLQVERTAFDLILLDMMLPGMDGPGFVERVRGSGVRHAHRRGVGEGVRRGQGGHAQTGGRRLRDQAVRSRRGGGPHPRGAAARQRGGRDRAQPVQRARQVRRVRWTRAGATDAAGASTPGATAPADPDETYAHRDLRLDVARRRVTLGDAEVALTAHEFDILHVLIREPDKVFSRERLYELVWKSGYYGEENAVNVHVSNIRKKLAAAGA